MRQTVDAILRQYGTGIRISGSGGDRTVKGFFQPVRAKSWQSLEAVATPQGIETRRQYVCIAPGDLEITEGEVLTVGQKGYVLRRAEKYYYGDQAVYTWCMCVEQLEENTALIQE